MDGKGKMIWSDGTIYEGEYKKDKKHGFGILTWRKIIYNIDS